MSDDGRFLWIADACHPLGLALRRVFVHPPVERREGDGQALVREGITRLLVTTMATVTQLEYGLSETTSGPVYLGLGIEHLLGIAFYARASDRWVKRVSQSGDTTPEVRLRGLVLGGPLCCGGLLWYGWSVHYHVFWIVPIIGSGMFGIGYISFVFPIITYLMDVWKDFAASAIAANVFLRFIGGGWLPLVAFDMYQTLGFGWGNTLLALVSLAMTAVPLILLRYGQSWREKYTVDL